MKNSLLISFCNSISPDRLLVFRNLLVVLALFGGSQMLQAQSASITTTANTFCETDVVTISSSYSGFTDGENLQVTITESFGSTTVFSGTVSNGSGNIPDQTFTLPSGSAGTVTFTITVDNTDDSAQDASSNTSVTVIAPALTTGDVVEDDPFCAGDTVTLAFAARCLRGAQGFANTSGSTYEGKLQVRLSSSSTGYDEELEVLASEGDVDANGNISISGSAITNGTAKVVIPTGPTPATAPFGIDYRFEVETVSGDFSSDGNGGNDDGSQEIRSLVITSPDPFPRAEGVLCQGERLELGYDAGEPASSFQAGNEFRIVLSGSDGLFDADKRIIGRIRSTATSGSIIGGIPYDAEGGNLYKIRIEATNQTRFGCEYGPFTIPSLRQLNGPFNDLLCDVGGLASFSAGVQGLNAGLTTTFDWERVCYGTIDNEMASLPDPGVQSLAGGGGRIFAATSTGLAIDVDDDGSFDATRTTADGLSDDMVLGVFVDPGDPNDVYAYTVNGLSYSTNAGNSFNSRTLFGFSILDIFALNDKVWAVTSNGLYEIDNNGAGTPSQINSTAGNAVAVNVDANGFQNIYYGTAQGLLVSRNGGSFTNVSLSAGLNSPIVNDVALSGDSLVVLATALGISFSNDGGYRFLSAGSGLSENNVQFVEISGEMIFAGTLDGLAVTNIGVLENGSPQVFVELTERDGLGNNLVTGIYGTGQASAKTLRVGTLSGVSRFALSKTQIASVSGPLSSIDVTKDFEAAKCFYQVVASTEVNGFTCEAVSNPARIAEIPPPFPANLQDEVMDVTECGGINGSVLIRGLLPNLEYQVNYTITSDVANDFGPLPASGELRSSSDTGTIRISNMQPGDYELTLTSPVSGCSNVPVTITVSEPDKPANPAVPAEVAKVCSGSSDFAITLPSMPPADVVYRWYLDAAGTPANPSLAETATYEPDAMPTADGSYFVDAVNTVTGCVSDTIEIPFEVEALPELSLASTQPTTQGGTGTITITIDNYDNTQAYTLNYLFNGAAQPAITLATGGTGQFVIDPADQGQYNDITVTSAGGCTSAASSVGIGFIVQPDDEVAGQIPSTQEAIAGLNGGYMQNTDNPAACAGDDQFFQVNASGNFGIAVGRLRDPEQPVPDNEPANVEMRGYVLFNLAAAGIPKDAVIERVEYQPVSLTGGGRTICTLSESSGVVLRSATGDLQFDVTQVEDTNYAPYLNFDSAANQDFFDEKYNDFTISANSTGAWMGLGDEGIADVQRRLARDGNELFQVGLSLSGSDFDIPVLQFHGVVFADASQHRLRVTYHRRDYGDLGEGKYVTDISGGFEGPSHRIDSIDVDPDPDVVDNAIPMFIGATPPDAELNANTSATADGDDNDADGDDEDLDQSNFVNPLTNNQLIAGNSITLNVPYTNNIPNFDANLLVFIDWDDDGVFNNTNERYSVAAPTGSAASVAVNIDIPAETTTGLKAVRVRLSSEQTLDAYGHARNGEVEDFFTQVTAYDYADLPDASDTTANGDYQTIYALDGSRGPRHLIVPGLSIGTAIDAEADGQPQLNGFGDDVSGIDDEDGIAAPDSIRRGEPAVFEVLVVNTTASTAYLQGFADWDDDGDFEDTDIVNQKAPLVAIPAGESGIYEVVFDVPQVPNPLPERVATRFRLSTDAELVVSSLGPDDANDGNGEVQDLFVDIVGYDWGDLPDPRYITDATGGQPGPSHRIRAVVTDTDTLTALYIGATVPDAEIEGQPTEKATGDDDNTVDDEDLNTSNFVDVNTNVSKPLVAGDSIRLQIPYTNNLSSVANLLSFIDWNGDGDFEDDRELRRVIVAPQSSGTVDIDYLVPNIPAADSIGVRIRITSADFIDAYGQAPDGEVEDLLIELRGAEYGDLPDLTAGLAPNDFQTLRQNNGPRHGIQVTPLTFLGTLVDADSDGQPNEEGTGDDQDTEQADDEDGVVFLTPLVPGKEARIALTATNNNTDDATIYVYTDWENDGTLDLVTTVPVAAGNSLTAEQVSFQVPAFASFEDGNAYWRFRITTDANFMANPSPNGLATDGEVEDYLLPVFKLGNLVWEDRNHNGLQDDEEINLGLENVTVILRFGGVDPEDGAYDAVNQMTATDPQTADLGSDLINDFVIDTLTNAQGKYLFTGMIEGDYQIIAVDPSGLTPTRSDWITNVTEEDRDSDGAAFKQPWVYADTDIRQAKTQTFRMDRDSIGTDEEGIADQGNPALSDANSVEAFPDMRIEQRIDFGYVPFDFGDLAATYTTEEDGVAVGTTQAGLFNTDTVLVGNVLEGPKHIVTPDVYLGVCSDAEVEGQPDFDAGQEFAPAADGAGDDPMDSAFDSDNDANICTDDDNGVQFMTPLIPGYEVIIDVDFFATINNDGPDAFLQAFLDWNGDGDFYVDGDPAKGFDEDEHIVFTELNGAAAPLEPNTNAVELEMSQQLDQKPIRLTFQVPDSAKYADGNVLARFRIGKQPNLAATGILPGNENFADGIVPEGEVEDYFMKLVKIGNIVWEDRDYDGIQDEDEPGIAGVEITLDYFGENDTLDGDFYENTYVTETDSTGRYYFCGLLGNVDPSGIMDPFYTLTASDPEDMTATIDLDSIAPGEVSNCERLNSDGSDSDIDDRITAVTFRVTNPMTQCEDELDPDGKLDQGEITIMEPDNIWPDEQLDETFDFGFVGFDYGDLPDTSIAAEFLYRTKRDWLPVAPIDFGPRHAIQPRLYLGAGVDAELDGQPDDDSGSKAGGDDDDPSAFAKGDATDDENGVRLLSPMLPGERAFLQITYTSQDTLLAGGYEDKDAFLNAFIDFNGDGDLDDAEDQVTFTFQGSDLNSLTSINTSNPTLPGGDSLTQVLAFTVPDTAITQFNDGVAFMRFRLSWEGELGPDNNEFHISDHPHVDISKPYPRGEVEDYAIPVAQIGNLAWYDHNVNGRQDDPLLQLYNEYVDEYGVDTLHLVLVWGGIDAATGDPDTVGFNDANMSSLGAIADIQYNLSIAPPTGGDYDPAEILKTNAQGLYSFRGLIPGQYNLIPLKYLQADSASFVDFWPKHRVLTLKDNPDASDFRDSDAGPGVVFTINDANDREPEVCVNDLPQNEDGELDDIDPATALFADSTYDQSIDLGFVDEPNIEASLDVVGVDFPSSEICGNFNVIMHLCVKNPTEVPLDSLMMELDLKAAYGGALFEDSKPIVSIVDSAFVVDPSRVRVPKSFAGAREALTPFINDNYNGVTDLNLLTGGDKDTDFFLPGDSVVCVRVEFEINPDVLDAYDDNLGWMSQATVYARAVGFLYEEDGAGRNKRPLLDVFPKSPRFLQPIQVKDRSDEFDDPMPMEGLSYPEAGDSILFEGMVMDRGDFGEYLVFNNNLTGRDKYLDENDKTLQNDSCWVKTRMLSGREDVNIGLDENCEAYVTPATVISNWDPNCGFPKYPEGSYYRVIIQDAKTHETLWASVDREPFDATQYLDRELIYEARSVVNYCVVIWGHLNFEDKLPPVVTCPVDTDTSFTTGRPLVCTDIDSILNNPLSYNDPTFEYYTGIATAIDGCEIVYLDDVNDVLEVFSDCNVSAENDYVYAQIKRTFRFRDQFDNIGVCTQTIRLRRPQIVLPDCEVFIPNRLAGTDTIITPADLVAVYDLPEAVPYYINGAGDTVRMVENDYCGIDLNYENQDVFLSENCNRKIIRRWRISDDCYRSDEDYPNYLVIEEERGDCYEGSTWVNGNFEFEQTIVIGDKAAPVVTIPDLDEDGFTGSGYQNGPEADPEVSTPTFDAEDVYEFGTRPQDCAADFRVTRDLFDVVDDSEWCFDLDVVARRPVLDLDERPTGEFEIEGEPSATITGNCDDGFLVRGLEMPKDTMTDYFLKLRFEDVCGKDTLIFAPIRVIDDVKPVVKCDDELEVTFNNFGTGQVAAVDLDEGTYDNCMDIIWLTVRRPLNECGQEFASLSGYVDANGNNIVDAGDYIDENRNQEADEIEFFVIDQTSEGREVLFTPFLDEVPFFCCDRDSVYVELWAQDWSGNRNNCWTLVNLTNRPPIDLELPDNFTLPDNVTYNCIEEEANVFVLSENEGRFEQGSLVYQTAIALFRGDIEFIRNNTCPGFTTAIQVEPDLDQCRTGTIDVTWLVSNGEEERVAGTRTINVVDLNDYAFRLPADQEYRCVPGVEDSIRGVEILENGCDLLAISVEDQRLTATAEPDACYKILRTYSIINWCEYDGEAQPTVVARDWDALNGENPLSPDGDDIAGNSDLFVIVKRNLADDQPDTVYYDNNFDPYDVSIDADNGFWWNVVSGNADPGTEDYYEGNGSVWARDFNQFDSDISGNVAGDDTDQRYGSFGFWQYTQHIAVYDDQDPELSISEQDTFPTLGDGSCTGEAVFTIEATDACTSDEEDVTIQVIVNGADLSEQLTGGVFQGIFAEGQHTLQVIANDGCGNVATRTVAFVIEDQKGPAPITLDGLAVELSSSANLDDEGGRVAVTAEAFLTSPIYDCNGQDFTDLDDNGNPRVTRFSINIAGDTVDMDQTELVFTCADAFATVPVEIHAFDELGNHDFTVANLTIQDNNGVCDEEAGEGQIVGIVTNEVDAPVSQVDIQLSGTASAFVTNTTGTYSFIGLQENGDYSVIPQKDINHGNGVSTLDLIQIQRHILGNRALPSVYAQIAADVNRSGSITTFDIIGLRKLILNTITTFDDNTSWRFVDANFQFPNPDDAFEAGFPEVKNINNLKGTQIVDFVAVKVGDVNNSADATEPRSDRDFRLRLDGPAHLEAGQRYELSLSAEQLQQISGYQFSLLWDTDAVKLIDLQPGLSRADQIAVFADEGALTTSWNKTSSDLSAGALFTLTVELREDMTLEDVLRLSSRYTVAEAYEQDTDRLMGVVLESNGKLQQSSMELYQNTPNPFLTTTTIGFYLPEASATEITLHDVTGRVLRTYRANYDAGQHSLRIDRDQLPAGTLFYTLSNGEEQITKAMLLER